MSRFEPGETVRIATVDGPRGRVVWVAGEPQRPCECGQPSTTVLVSSGRAVRWMCDVCVRMPDGGVP